VTPDGIPSPSASVGHPPIKVEGGTPRDSPQHQSTLQQQQQQQQQASTPVCAPQARDRPPQLGLPNPAMLAHSLGQNPQRRGPPPSQMRAPSPPLSNQQAAPPPEVCLRWNSYHSNMQATFPSLLNNEQFVDVTLACEGHSIKCHKVSIFLALNLYFLALNLYFLALKLVFLALKPCIVWPTKIEGAHLRKEVMQFFGPKQTSIFLALKPCIFLPLKLKGVTFA